MGNDKPGYPAFQPASYQVVGPEQDPSLDKILCRAPAGETTDTPSIVFLVATPNVRMRTRVAISLEPVGTTVNVDAQAYTAVVAAAADLWVASKTLSRGPRVKAPPTRNIVGTAAAPLAIPTDTRLWGYEFELETAGELLRGYFVPPASDAGSPGYTWRVQVRYEAVGARLSAEEWNQFRGQYGLTVDPEAIELS